MLMFIKDDIKINVLILDLEDTVANQDTRLTSAEENIQGTVCVLGTNLMFSVINIVNFNSCT